MSKLKQVPIILTMGVRKGIVSSFASTIIAIFSIRRTSPSKEPEYGKIMMLEWIDANHKPSGDLTLAH